MPPTPEFSRRIPLGRITPQGLKVTLEATAEERAVLARRFGIEAVDRLEAALELHAEPGGTVLVHGRLAADVTQACVVTLDPVAQSIDEPVELRFVPPGSAHSDDDLEGPDEIPISREGDLELGEAVTEQLALALHPYPRSEGAELPSDVLDPEAPGPFEALKGWRRA